MFGQNMFHEAFSPESGPDGGHSIISGQFCFVRAFPAKSENIRLLTSALQGRSSFLRQATSFDEAQDAKTYSRCIQKGCGKRIRAQIKIIKDGNTEKGTEGSADAEAAPYNADTVAIWTEKGAEKYKDNMKVPPKTGRAVTSGDFDAIGKDTTKELSTQGYITDKGDGTYAWTADGAGKYSMSGAKKDANVTEQQSISVTKGNLTEGKLAEGLKKETDPDQYKAQWQADRDAIKKEAMVEQDKGKAPEDKNGDITYYKTRAPLLLAKCRTRLQVMEGEDGDTDVDKLMEACGKKMQTESTDPKQKKREGPIDQWTAGPVIAVLPRMLSGANYPHRMQNCGGGCIRGCTTKKFTEFSDFLA